ncbi:LexA repressor [Actinoplanes sp. SE50]|uniref:ArsR/SmtB family transcription factor n=1 Tax=unclassified Actinoplanes TaxID=2626549 RepID=UPI00023ED5CB|nr:MULTISPECIES: winged helix-turn-helix domain-containing protein [unclassified Actinoplanes]AEV83936.1 LexA repressor [Actinoplanes sp. SE50/110]ATO81920.1 LexA repressor [Actinoplanes sp. SE50]SLL99328.1 ArsR-family transcriptional regulator [Actinoplanes sp. SE50/110]
MSLRVGGKQDQVTLRAVAHPARLHILSLLTGAPMTAAEVARELGMNSANAAYHLRTLYTAGVIELAGAERIRGGLAKRYRYDATLHAARASAGGGAPEPDRAVYAAISGELGRRAQHAEPGGVNALADAELWVDPRVWRAARDRINEVVRGLHEAAQKPRTPGALRTSTTVALFTMKATA